MPTPLHGPGCNLGKWQGCPLVVHCRRICNRCTGFVAMTTQHEREMSASACNHSMPVDYCDLQEHTSSTYQLICHKRLYNTFWATVCKTVRPMLSDPCLSCLSVCNVGVLWPNAWMDQDATSYGDRPRPRPHCVSGGPSSPHGKGHKSPHFSADVFCGKTVANLNNC